MSKNRILYMSGSLGLGHISRDLAIARELRSQSDDLEVHWLAAPPVDRVLQEAGENLLPESADLVDENEIAEHAARGSRLNLIEYGLGLQRQWSRNVAVVDRVVASGGYDLIVGDETYEILIAYKKDPGRKKRPFVMILDFIGFDAMTRNPLERLGVHFWNRKWSSGMNKPADYVDLTLFVGELEDVPDTSFGLLLPNRREWAEKLCEFVGYILPFDPEDLQDRAFLRGKLGYDDRPLVIGSIGGTAIGKSLLELCGRTFPLLTERIAGVQMVLVCGPRLDPASLDLPAGVEARGYVPDLHEHLAASDLAIVQGGGTITLELTALRRPFLYFPIEGHSEQEVHVAGRLLRHGAGERMTLSSTTPEALTARIVANLGTALTYPPIPVDGARIAAKKICNLL